MTKEQFDEQPIKKGDMIRFYTYSSSTNVECIIGVDWEKRVYFIEGDTIAAHRVIEYIES